MATKAGNKTAKRLHVSLARRSIRNDARQAILREISRRGLKVDDKLPPQDELRRQLKFSQDTLSLAMRDLTSEGILSRKTRIGTVVKDPQKIPKGLYTVGLAMPRLSDSTHGPVYAVIFGQLLDRLRRRGCECRVYPHLRREPGAEWGDPLNNFDGLAEDVEAGLLDGIVSTYAIKAEVCKALAARKLYLLQLGGQEPNAPLWVALDHRKMAVDGAKLLVERGCQRPALVQGRSYSVPRLEEYQHIQLVEPFLAEARVAATPSVLKTDFRGLVGGQALGAEVLRLPAKQRPDGLLIMEDYLAMGLTSALAAQRTYRPLIVVSTNRQAPLAFALPVLRLDSDVEAWAEQAVTTMLKVLRNPSRLPIRRLLAAQLDDPEPGLIPRHMKERAQQS